MKGGTNTWRRIVRTYTYAYCAGMIRCCHVYYHIVITAVAVYMMLPCLLYTLNLENSCMFCSPLLSPPGWLVPRTLRMRSCMRFVRPLAVGLVGVLLCWWLTGCAWGAGYLACPCRRSPLRCRHRPRLRARAPRRRWWWSTPRTRSSAQASSEASPVRQQTSEPWHVVCAVYGM